MFLPAWRQGDWSQNLCWFMGGRGKGSFVTLSLWTKICNPCLDHLPPPRYWFDISSWPYDLNLHPWSIQVCNWYLTLLRLRVTPWTPWTPCYENKTKLVQEHTLSPKFMRHTGDTGIDNDMRKGTTVKLGEWRILQENGLVPSISKL